MGFVCELRYQKALIPFEQPLRKRGFTKNNFYSLYDNAMIGFTNHSKVPLRMAAFIGFILSAVNFILGLVYLILKLIWWYRFPAGTAPLLIGVFFLGSYRFHPFGHGVTGRFGVDIGRKR